MRVLLCLTLVSLLSFVDNICIKNKIKLWSPTKCSAGKIFFVKLHFSKGVEIQQPYLYPWLTEIKVVRPGTIKHCSGALINDRYILTSQTCILGSTQPRDVTINFGFFNGYKKDLSEKFQKRTLQRKASRLILHPNFDPQNPSLVGNNLGLIQVDQPVIYSKTIYPIQLPLLGHQFFDFSNQLAENVEWTYGQQTGKKFQANSVKILSPQQCAQLNNNQKKKNRDVICAVKNNGGFNLCEGQGGLLSLETIQPTGNTTFLLGITSWDPSANSCQTLQLPRVYVRIDRKLQWIKKNTIDGLYCQY